MEEKRIEVIAGLRSCLISTKGKCDLTQIGEDFQILMGYKIPFAELGFKTLEQFILSISSLTTSRINGQLLIDAKPSEKSSHISALVDKQRGKKRSRQLYDHYRAPPPRNAANRHFHHSQAVPKWSSKNVQRGTTRKRSRTCKSLIIKDLSEPENNSIIICPTLPYTACIWKGPMMNIPDHFTEQHSDLVKQNAEFQLQVNENKFGVLMVVQNNCPFIIKYCYESTTWNLKYRVGYFTQKSEQNVCKIKLINIADADYVICLKGTECVPYNHNFSLGENETMLCLKNYFENLNKPASILVALILPEYIFENVARLVVDYELLASKKCSRCCDYLIPPIYENGERIICCDCSYSCEGYKLSRDAELHSRLVNYNFPCRWHGCEYLAKGVAIRSHENECKHRNYCCIVDYCTEYMLKCSKLIIHLKVNHDYKYFDDKFTHKLKFSEFGCYRYRDAFTVIGNEVVVVHYSYETCGAAQYTLKTTHTSNQHTIQICIEHKHCKRVSKIFFCNTRLGIPLRQLPKCFKGGEELSVTVKIA